MVEIGLVQILEGALLAAGRPLTIAQLAELFEEHERPAKEAVREALEEVAQRCEDRGFELQEVASGFRFQVRQSLSPWVARLWQERPQKYSRALLETLALIAYRQPITRGEIEEIRGVAVSSNIIKTLHEREWIRVVGHRDVPGRPAMYATTRQFLDYFNLKNLDQLPALAEIRDLETLNAELGFNEPLPEGSSSSEAADGEEQHNSGVPELAVVGGTDHVPADEAAEGELAAPGASPGEDSGAGEVAGAEQGAGEVADVALDDLAAAAAEVTAGSGDSAAAPPAPAEEAAGGSEGADELAPAADAPKPGSRG